MVRSTGNLSSVNEFQTHHTHCSNDYTLQTHELHNNSNFSKCEVKTIVVAIPTGRWFIQLKLALSVFAIVFGCFSPIKNLVGRTEMPTRERKQ